MTPPGRPQGRGRPRAWDAASAALLVVLLALVAATFLDYGVTADEGVQHRYGRRIVRWYATLGHDRSATEANNLLLYGGVFELAAQAAEAVSPLRVYDTRHLVNALFGVAGIAGAWGLGRLLGGPAAGFLSALFLSLTPGYYGHCFANPKDIPFAAFYALAACSILWADGARSLSPRVALAGAAVGLTAGIRANGIVLVAFAALLWAGTPWSEGRRPLAREAVRVGLTLAVLLAVAWAVMLACWPWAQLDPLANPIRSLRAFASAEGPPVLFEGRTIAVSDLPRRYAPELFALTLPELYLAALGLGIASLVRRRPATLAGTFRVLWVLSLAAAPLAWAVVGRTPLYNGVRHLLFVVPILAVLAGVSAGRALRSDLPRGVLGAGAVTLTACLALAATDMVRLHPYQYVYFNRLVAGGLPAAVGRYETDYWFASYKEGVEWVCGHYSRSLVREPILIGGNRLVPFSRYLDEGRCGASFFRAVSPEDKPNVLLVSTTAGRDRGPDGRVVHVVERLGAPLLLVYELKPPGAAQTSSSRKKSTPMGHAIATNPTSASVLPARGAPCRRRTLGIRVASLR